MENKFKNTGSALDHCRNCKCKLFEWEEDAALCGNCVLEFIEDTKKDNINFRNQYYK